MGRAAGELPLMVHPEDELPGPGRATPNVITPIWLRGSTPISKPWAGCSALWANFPGLIDCHRPYLHLLKSYHYYVA